MTKYIPFVLILVLVASCNPYAGLYTPVSTVTASPMASSTKAVSTVTVLPSPTGCIVSTGTGAGYLNLRTGPGVQYAVIRVLEEKELLTVMTAGAWYEVTDAKGNHGFVNSRFCKKGK